MELQIGDRGRLTVMHEYGADALTDAMKNGVMTANVRRAAERIIKDNEEMQRKLEEAEQKITILEGVLEAHRKADIAARTQYYMERAERRDARTERRARMAGMMMLGIAIGSCVISVVAMRMMGV